MERGPAGPRAPQYALLGRGQRLAVPRRADGPDRVLVDGRGWHFAIRAEVPVRDLGKVGEIRHIRDGQGRIVAAPPLASAPRPRRWRVRQLDELCFLHRRQRVKSAGGLGESTRGPVFELPLLALALSPLLLPLFLFDQKGPPTRENVAPLRQHALDDRIDIHAGAPHPVQRLLLQVCCERLRALHFQDLLLLRRVLGEERVGENVGQGGPEQRAFREQPLQQRQGVGGYVVRVVGLLGQNLGPRDAVVIIVERQLAAEQGVENHTQTPHVHLFARVLLPLEHLGRRIAYCPAKSLQVVGLALVFAREAKVAELDVLVFVEQDVFELEVAVDAGLRVDVAYGADELGEGFLDLVDGELAMLEEVVVQLVT